MLADKPTLPARLGRYELVDHIATGGMAEVFLARSFGVQGFRKHVVVKRLRPGLAQAPLFVQLFVQEARISAGLVHPNIVQIHELGAVEAASGTVHYIAMEYIHGQDLTRLRRALTAQGRTMPPGLAVFCVARVLRALAYAHSRTDTTGRRLGLVHRDVSPHNVLVTFQGQVKLVDFGIARLEGDAAGGGLPGGGKYAYMSPEQASGRPVSDRSDVFSAGIVLWELLVGRRLFKHADPEEKLRRVRAAEVPDPRRDNPAIPASLWAVLERMLAPEPEARPSAGEAEELLQAVLFEEGLRAEGAALGRLLQELFPEAARRDPGGLDLEGLAEDLASLERTGSEHTGSEHTGSERTGSERTGLERTGPGSLPPGERGPAEEEHTGSLPDGSLPDGSTEADGTDSSAEVLTSLPAFRGLAPGERKTVVVLCGEVTGFTEPSTQHDPEFIARGHYRLLRRLRRVVDRHGGLLDRFHDDRFTVFFGLPRTGEHDLDHALACAAQLVRGAGRLRRRGGAVALSIGVHLGDLTLGRVGGRNLRYLARGDTTKLAKRLCHAADLDEVLVSDRVRVAARTRFRFQRGPEVRRRGGEGGGPSWRLLGRDTGVHDTAGSWLSRGDEREVLSRSLRRVAGGERVVLAVQGPAGTGKSRLLQELRDLAAARGVPVYAARAVPYAADRPLATLRDIVARVMGLSAEAEVDQLEAGLRRLADLGLEEQDLAVIGALFGLDSDNLGRRGLEELVLAAGRFVRRLAAGGAVLLAVEDAQHLSELEQQVLRHIHEATEDVPVLLLLTLRGEVPAGLRPVDEQIVLGPLSPALQRRLAAHLLGARLLDDTLAEHIAATAEGNARYVAALAQALRDAGRVVVDQGTARLVEGVGAPPLPDDLEGIIAARVDSLDPQSRQALQVAAIIGPRLSVGLLAEAAGQAELAPVLDQLVARGLFSRDGDELAFASELVAEVVGGTVVGARRRELHGLVAAAMERHLGRTGGHLSQLAEHCARAGRCLDAARYGHAAGDQLRRQQLLQAAVLEWEHAVGWLGRAAAEGADTSACLQGEALLHFKLGQARALLGEGRAATRHLQAAMDAASECEDAELEARCTLELGRVYRSAGQDERARLHLESAREAAVGLGRTEGWRREVAVEALELLGLLAHEAGDREGSEALYAEALAQAGDDDALAARALLGLASRHIRAGEQAQALDLLARAGAKAATAGDRILLGRIVNNTGLVHHGAGRYREAISCFEEARDLRRDTGYVEGEATNLHNIGDAWARLGQPGRAWAAFSRSRDLARSIGWTRGVVMNDVWMAWLEGNRAGGEPEAVAAAAARADSLGDLDTALTGQWLYGRLLRARGHEAQGRRVLGQALDQARALGAVPMCRDIESALHGSGAGRS